MQARIGNPMVLAPDAGRALMALGQATRDEKELGNLVMSIGVVNLWNRLNRATRQRP